jgi:fatty acid synthase
LQVCAQAGIEPSQVAYVEAHGTGTVVGDGQELGALEEFYAIKVCAVFILMVLFAA